jgi:protein-disulfide isomerase
MRTFALIAAAVAALAGCSTPEKVQNKGAATTCAAASLALPPETIVGSVDGKPITLADLGPEAQQAEQQALWEYCDNVYAQRARALDGYVTQKLVERAAAAAGKDVDDWMREEMQKRAKPPTEEEIQAFYNARARPGAPPLEAVKLQVVQAMSQERAQDAVREVIEEVKKGVAVEKKLPDVRSPPRDVDIPSHTATKGKKGAKVRVVEFADFECPYCSRAADTVRQLQEKYGDRVEFAYRHFPLRTIHPEAQGAAEAAQCAARQGKFWEMHDKLYAAQDRLDAASLKQHAAALGLDPIKLDQCLTSGAGNREVEEDLKKGEALGVEGTPTFFVNGRAVASPSVDAISQAIEAELGGKG